MNKYPLIVVSIIVIVLLILGSLTNVVGYQSVKSTSLSDSPLFSVRTKRAINQDCKDVLTSDYLGKGIIIGLQFPTRENRTIILQKIINIIRNMDDKEFSRFLNLIISHSYEDEYDKNIDSITVLSILKQIRSYTKELPINKLGPNGTEKDPSTSQAFPMPSINQFPPWCIILRFGLDLLLLIILGIVYGILFIILTVNCRCWNTVV